MAARKKRKRKAPKRRRRAPVGKSGTRRRGFAVRFGASDSKRIRAAARVPPARTPSTFVKLAVDQAIRGTEIVQRAVSAGADGHIIRSDADFATVVLRAARSPHVAKFHEDRAYIASVFEMMPPAVIEDGLADFKKRLVRLHRAGLLRLTRADLVRAMDADLLERSETKYQQTEFHFVALK